MLALDVTDLALDLTFVNTLRVQGAHGYAALMAITTLLSATVGVCAGRHLHASASLDYVGAWVTFILAAGEMFSFCTEDATTLFIYARLDGAYTPGSGADELNLLTTAASSIVVALILAFGAAGEVADVVRKGEFRHRLAENILLVILAPCCAVALVCYFAAVAWAIYVQDGGHPALAGELLVGLYVVSWVAAAALGGAIVHYLRADERDEESKYLGLEDGSYTVWARLASPRASLANFLSCRQLEDDE